MSDLLGVQQRLRDALRDPTISLDDIIPDAARRLAVHRGTIELGLTQTLVRAFPALRRIVGGSTFAMLAAEFNAAAPPAAPLLSGYGGGFPGFVARQPITASLPYLPDLARVEWLRQEAYLAPDAPVLDPRSLDTTDADSLSTLSLRIHPAVRLISSPFPVYEIWRVNQADVGDADIPTVEMSRAESVLISRPGGEVVTRKISLADAGFVRAIITGENLGSAVETAVAIDACFEPGPALALHFANGTFASP